MLILKTKICIDTEHSLSRKKIEEFKKMVLSINKKKK